MSEEKKTYSIALHLRRVTHEDAYVSVFVTDAITKENADGTRSIDFDAFVAEAIRVSKNDEVEWKTEESYTEPHPIQCPLPEGRRAFDSYYLSSDTE